MTRVQLLIAALTAISLTLLFTWQVRREDMVRACVDGSPPIAKSIGVT
jgi:hypothetical protein